MYRGAAHTFYPDATVMSESFEWLGGCRVVKIRGMDYDERLDFVIEMLNQKNAILRGALEECGEYPQQGGNYLYSKRLCKCIGCYNRAARRSGRAKASSLPMDLCNKCKTDLEPAVTVV